MAMRSLIFKTAAGLPEVGPIEETLRWGQPTYLTTQTKSGSMIRLDIHQGSSNQYALYFHCQTSLVDTFRSIYSNELNFEKNRAIVFETDRDIPWEAVTHCISMALTYRLKSR